MSLSLIFGLTSALATWHPTEKLGEVTLPFVSDAGEVINLKVEGFDTSDVIWLSHGETWVYYQFSLQELYQQVFAQAGISGSELATLLEAMKYKRTRSPHPEAVGYKKQRRLHHPLVIQLHKDISDSVWQDFRETSERIYDMPGVSQALRGKAEEAIDQAKESFARRGLWSARHASPSKENSRP